MNKKALLQKINQAAEEQVETLDLSGTGIDELPAEIGSLTNLTWLDLSDNQLTAIPPEIGKLTRLTRLYLSRNQLTTIPLEMGTLTNLTRLTLAHNQLRIIPPEIGKLTRLNWLHLYENQFTTIPAEIGKLTQLTKLYLYHNRLTTIPPEIGQLTQLTRLSLYNNQLTALPPEIGKLTQLYALQLYNNQLTTLPPEIGKLTKLATLILNNNPNLTSPPPAIVEQGTKAILAYLREQLEGETEQWVSKMLLVGEGGVGKTSTLCSLLNIPFNGEEETTRGVDIRDLDLNHPEKSDVTIRLNCWDFGGQTIYHATHQFFLTDRSLFILVWDTRHGWEAGKLYKWLDTIQARAPHSPILLVAAHIDERDADLPLAELKRKYPQIVDQFKVSNKKQTGIEDLRAAITKAAAKLPLMGEKWPAAWLNAAEAIREREEQHITAGQLTAAMAEHNVTGDNAGILAKWMHDLGDILYFDDDEELKDTVILEPEWVSKYIGRVLESEEVADGVGIFTRELMEELWDDIDLVMRDRFLRLMEKFDLSYRTLEDREISLVVERLSLDPADYEEQWDAIKNNPDCNEISLKFALNTIPAGIPTWFIARSHRFTTRTHWRSGALFTDDKEKRHLALVYVDEHLRCIHLIVRGPVPHNFFTKLKDGLELTLERFPGLKIKRSMPCPGHGDVPCIFEFSYESLIRAIEKEPPVDNMQCQEAFTDVPVRGLLYGLHPNTNKDVLSHIEELNVKLDKQRDQISPAFQLIQYQQYHPRAIVDEPTMKDLSDKIDLFMQSTAAAFYNLSALIARGFTNQFKIEQAKIESHCPNVFVLHPLDPPAWQKFFLKSDSLRKELPPSRLELHLCCQAPGSWHPTIDNGVYKIKRSWDWLMTMTPLLQHIIPVLTSAVGLAVTGIPIIAPDIAKRFVGSIKFMKEILKILPDLNDLALNNPAEFDLKTPNQGPYFEGAALRALRKFLDDQDPAQHWGGLKKILTPEGHYLWLCDFHAKEYAR